MGNPGDSNRFLTLHPGRYDKFRQWHSIPGAVLTFKIKRFPPPGVGNNRDSDTKDANEGGDIDRKKIKMSESPGFASKGSGCW